MDRLQKRSTKSSRGFTYTYYVSDLAATNAFLEEATGRPLLAYQELLVSDEGPALLRDRAGRLYDGMHGAPRDFLGELLCVRGNLKRWLLSGDDDDDGAWRVDQRAYATRDPAAPPEIRRAAREGEGRAGGPGLLLPGQHRARAAHPHEVALPRERLVDVGVPVLFIGCLQDAIVTLDRSHWSPLELPGPVGSAVDSFLARKILK
ncbi:hypothetical protein F4778DRAFT_775677 [Xylariomycetidae sp. FL2044]|nr:hypothetical protein F4778DRAFT_775677 [Xylariomycetidae sp. FL2044]